MADTYYNPDGSYTPPDDGGIGNPGPPPQSNYAPPDNTPSDNTYATQSGGDTWYNPDGGYDAPIGQPGAPDYSTDTTTKKAAQSIDGGIGNPGPPPADQQPNPAGSDNRSWWERGKDLLGSAAREVGDLAGMGPIALKDTIEAGNRPWDDPGAFLKDAYASAAGTLGNTVKDAFDVGSRIQGSAAVALNDAKAGNWGQLASDVNPASNAYYSITGDQAPWMGDDEYTTRNVVSRNPSAAILPGSGGSGGGRQIIPDSVPIIGGDTQYDIPIFGGLARGEEALRGSLTGNARSQGPSLDVGALQQDIANGMPYDQAIEKYKGSVGASILSDLINPVNFVEVPGVGEAVASIFETKTARALGEIADKAKVAQTWTPELAAEGKQALTDSGGRLGLDMSKPNQVNTITETQAGAISGLNRVSTAQDAAAILYDGASKIAEGDTPTALQWATQYADQLGSAPAGVLDTMQRMADGMRYNFEAKGAVDARAVVRALDEKAQGIRDLGTDARNVPYRQAAGELGVDLDRLTQQIMSADPAVAQRGLEARQAVAAQAARDIAKSDLRAGWYAEAGYKLPGTENQLTQGMQGLFSIVRGLMLAGSAPPLALQKFTDEWFRALTQGTIGVRASDTAIGQAMARFAEKRNILGQGERAQGFLNRSTVGNLVRNDILPANEVLRKVNPVTFRGAFTGQNRYGEAIRAGERFQALASPVAKWNQSLIAAPTGHVQLNALWQDTNPAALARNAEASARMAADAAWREGAPPALVQQIYEDALRAKNPGEILNIGRRAFPPIVPDRGMAQGSPARGQNLTPQVRQAIAESGGQPGLLRDLATPPPTPIDYTPKQMARSATAGEKTAQTWAQGFDRTSPDAALPVLPRIDEPANSVVPRGVISAVGPLGMKIELAGKTAGQLADEIALRSQPFYHGSAAADLTRETMQAGTGGMGPGHYFTTDRGYAGMRAGNGTVYEARLGPNRTLDFDAPLPDDARAAALGAVGNDAALARGVQNATTTADLYDVIRDTPGISAVNAALKDAGYDALSLTNATGRHVTLLNPDALRDLQPARVGVNRGSAGGGTSQKIPTAAEAAEYQQQIAAIKALESGKSAPLTGELLPANYRPADLKVYGNEPPPFPEGGVGAAPIYQPKRDVYDPLWDNPDARAAAGLPTRPQAAEARIPTNREKAAATYETIKAAGGDVTAVSRDEYVQMRMQQVREGENGKGPRNPTGQRESAGANYDQAVAEKAKGGGAEPIIPGPRGPTEPSQYGYRGVPGGWQKITAEDLGIVPAEKGAGGLVVSQTARDIADDMVAEGVTNPATLQHRARANGMAGGVEISDAEAQAALTQAQARAAGGGAPLDIAAAPESVYRGMSRLQAAGLPLDPLRMNEQGNLYLTRSRDLGFQYAGENPDLLAQFHLDPRANLADLSNPDVAREMYRRAFTERSSTGHDYPFFGQDYGEKMPGYNSGSMVGGNKFPEDVRGFYEPGGNPDVGFDLQALDDPHVVDALKRMGYHGATNGETVSIFDPSMLKLASEAPRTGGAPLAEAPRPTATTGTPIPKAADLNRPPPSFNGQRAGTTDGLVDAYRTGRVTPDNLERIIGTAQQQFNAAWAANDIDALQQIEERLVDHAQAAAVGRGPKSAEKIALTKAREDMFGPATRGDAEARAQVWADARAALEAGRPPVRPELTRAGGPGPRQVTAAEKGAIDRGINDTSVADHTAEYERWRAAQTDRLAPYDPNAPSPTDIYGAGPPTAEDIARLAANPLSPGRVEIPNISIDPRMRDLIGTPPAFPREGSAMPIGNEGHPPIGNPGPPPVAPLEPSIPLPQPRDIQALEAARGRAQAGIRDAAFARGTGDQAAVQAGLERGYRIVGNNADQTTAGMWMKNGVGGVTPPVLPFAPFHIHSAQFWAQYFASHPALALGMAQVLQTFDDYGTLKFPEGNSLAGLIKTTTGLHILDWAQKAYEYATDVNRAGGNNIPQQILKNLNYNLAGNNAFVRPFEYISGPLASLTQRTTNPLLSGKLDYDTKQPLADSRDLLREYGTMNGTTGFGQRLNDLAGSPLPRNVVTGATNPGQALGNLLQRGTDTAFGVNRQEYNPDLAAAHALGFVADQMGLSKYAAERAYYAPQTPQDIALGKQLHDAVNVRLDTQAMGKLAPVQARGAQSAMEANGIYQPNTEKAYMLDMPIGGGGFTGKDLLNQPGNYYNTLDKITQAKAQYGDNSPQVKALQGELAKIRATDVAQAPGPLGQYFDALHKQDLATYGDQTFRGKLNPTEKQAYDAFNDLKASRDYKARTALEQQAAEANKGKDAPKGSAEHNAYTDFYKKNGDELTRLNNIVNGAEQSIVDRFGVNPKELSNRAAVAAGYAPSYADTTIQGQKPVGGVPSTPNTSSNNYPYVPRSGNTYPQGNYGSSGRGGSSGGSSTSTRQAGNDFYNLYNGLTDKGEKAAVRQALDRVGVNPLGQKGVDTQTFTRALAVAESALRTKRAADLIDSGRRTSSNQASQGGSRALSLAELSALMQRTTGIGPAAADRGMLGGGSSAPAPARTFSLPNPGSATGSTKTPAGYFVGRDGKLHKSTIAA